MMKVGGVVGDDVRAMHSTQLAWPRLDTLGLFEPNCPFRAVHLIIRYFFTWYPWSNSYPSTHFLGGGRFHEDSSPSETLHVCGFLNLTFGATLRLVPNFFFGF